MTNNKFYTNVFIHNNVIYERGYENGVPYFRKVRFMPKIYTSNINSNTNIRCITEQNIKLEEHVFDSVSELRKFCYSTEKTLYGNLNAVAQYIDNAYQGVINLDSQKVKKMFFDIETTAEEGFPYPEVCNQEITLITCGYEKGKCVTFSAYKQYTGNQSNVDFRYFDSEAEMLKNFIVWFENEKPDIFSGYYSETFDVRYLFNRIKKVLNKQWLNRLSPVGNIAERKQYETGKEEPSIFYKITGIQTLDYLDIYKKFHFGEVSSYKLDNIAELEIGWRKIENPTNTFKEFYNGTFEFKEIPEKFKDLECVQLSYERYLAKEKCGEHSNEYAILDAKTKQSFWNLFVEYNVRDVELLIMLEEKLSYLNLLMVISFMQKCNFEDAMGTIAHWHNRLYSYLYNKGYVWKNPKGKINKESFEGGYVKAPQTGLHGYVVSFDYTSLYPTLIRALGISPETFKGVIDIDAEDLLEQKLDLSELIEKNLALGANGALYDNSVDGFLPEIITEIFNQRKKEKSAKQDYARQIEELIKTLPDNIDIDEFNLEELENMLKEMN